MHLVKRFSVFIQSVNRTEELTCVFIDNYYLHDEPLIGVIDYIRFVGIDWWKLNSIADFFDLYNSIFIKIIQSFVELNYY